MGLRARVWALAGGFCVRNGFGGNFVFTNVFAYSKKKFQLNVEKSCKKQWPGNCSTNLDESIT